MQSTIVLIKDIIGKNRIVVLIASLFVLTYAISNIIQTQKANPQVGSNSICIATTGGNGDCIGDDGVTVCPPFDPANCPPNIGICRCCTCGCIRPAEKSVSLTSQAAPTNLQAILSGCCLVGLSFTDNSTDETGFIIERSVDGGLTYLLLTTLPPNTTSYVDNASPSTSYCYQVKAQFAATLEIAKPLPEEDFSLDKQNLTATGVLFSSKIDKAIPSDIDEVQWEVRLEYANLPQNLRRFVTNKQRLLDSHNEVYKSMGGKLTMNATGLLKTQTVVANPVTAYVIGNNIPEQDITNRVVSLYQQVNGATPRLITGIVAKESTYFQFVSFYQVFNHNGLWPHRPLKGGSGSFVGLMMIPLKSMAVAWDWEENTAEGVRFFSQEKIRLARIYMNRIIKANPGLRSLTEEEIERMALLLYGPGSTPDLKKQYYIPQKTAAGVDWVVNSKGNTVGVNYAKQVFALMR